MVILIYYIVTWQVGYGSMHGYSDMRTCGWSINNKEEIAGKCS